MILLPNICVCVCVCGFWSGKKGGKQKTVRVYLKTCGWTTSGPQPDDLLPHEPAASHITAARSAQLTDLLTHWLTNTNTYYSQLALAISIRSQSSSECGNCLAAWPLGLPFPERYHVNWLNYQRCITVYSSCFLLVELCIWLSFEILLHK